MTVAKTRLLIIAVICFVTLGLFAPIETTLMPPWRIQVVDVSGTACSGMRVTQSWGHYRLYLDGNDLSRDGLTDANGYVQFPERRIQASLSRRIMMPIVTRVATIMHGGWRISGAVWASGIKDVAWLSYHGGNSLPDKMRVEKCINAGVE